MTIEKTRKEFAKGYNCAQVVLMHFAEQYGMDCEKAAQISAHFGGGMMAGSACGAFTGALMAIGLAGGEDGKTKCAEFRTRFIEKNGSCVCPNLLKFDLTKPEEAEEAMKSGRMMEFCPTLVKETIDILEELL